MRNLIIIFFKKEKNCNLRFDLFIFEGLGLQYDVLNRKKTNQNISKKTQEITLDKFI